MPWLTRDSEVLAAVSEPTPGWQRSLEAVVILHRPALVHTLVGRDPLDVAWCRGPYPGGPLVVVRVGRLRPRRVAVPALRASVLVVARGGAFARWQLRPGDALEVRS